MNRSSKPRSRRNRHKILLDEDCFKKERFLQTNSLFNLKHIKHDFKLQGIADELVLLTAKKTNRIIVTYNGKDFKRLYKDLDKSTGLIICKQNMDIDRLDQKLCSLLHNKTKGRLYGYVNTIGEN